LYNKHILIKILYKKEVFHANHYLCYLGEEKIECGNEILKIVYIKNFFPKRFQDGD
jgi:hypothetical protein